MSDDIKSLIKEFRDGLEGVTPGPWNVEYGESGNGPDRHSYALLMRTEDEWPTGIETGDVHCIDGSRLMEHIARCSPENIAKLLDAAESSLASPAGMEGWTRAVRDVFEIELKINRAEPMEAMERALAAASVEFAAPHGEAK